MLCPLGSRPFAEMCGRSVFEKFTGKVFFFSSVSYAFLSVLHSCSISMASLMMGGTSLSCKIDNKKKEKET